MDKGQTNLNCTQEPESSNSAKEGSDDEDGWDETYSFHSRQCHRVLGQCDLTVLL